MEKIKEAIKEIEDVIQTTQNVLDAFHGDDAADVDTYLDTNIGTLKSVINLLKQSIQQSPAGEVRLSEEEAYLAMNALSFMHRFTENTKLARRTWELWQRLQHDVLAKSQLSQPASTRKAANDERE
jgi:hypothetical protein